MRTGLFMLLLVWLWFCFEHWWNQPAAEPTAEIAKPEPRKLEEPTEFMGNYIPPKFSIRQFSMSASIALVIIAALALASRF